MTSDIVNGRWTIQFRISGLDVTSTRDVNGLSVEVLTSDAFDDGKPVFDGTTDWPIGSDSLDANGDAIARFDDAYVANGVLVAGIAQATTITIHSTFAGLSIPLHVHAALLTFDVGTKATLTNGVIAGALDANELAQTIRVEAGRISPSLCGAASDSIVEPIRRTADILVDRSNAPNVPCAGISFAMGFHAKRVANPTKVAPVSTVDPCAASGDAGAD